MSYLSDLLADLPADRKSCWLWPGRLRPDGRPHINLGLEAAIRHGGFDLYAYRAVYESLIGPVPDGLELDHLCRVPACVNPWHLEPVTQAVNARRAHARFGSVRRLPSGRWQARYIYQGRDHKAPDTFGTPEAAEAWLATQNPRP